MQQRQEELTAEEGKSTQKVELGKLKELVLLNENLRAQEAAFKAGCKAQLQDMNERIKAFESGEEEADSDGSAMRARMAARVLLGERCALEACIALWRREEAAVTAALGEEASGASSTAAADEKKSS